MWEDAIQRRKDEGWIDELIEEIKVEIDYKKRKKRDSMASLSYFVMPEWKPEEIINDIDRVAVLRAQENLRHLIQLY